VVDAAVLLARGADLDRLTLLRERLPRRRLRLLVAGEAKRGKSTVVNALLGRGVLPTGVLPLTSSAVTVTAADLGEPERALVVFVGSGREWVPLERIAAFATEAGNPGNALGVVGVEVRLHCGFLDDCPVDVVDTPGTGSVYEHNTVDALAAVATLDAAVLVLSADTPLSAAEASLLREVTDRSVRTFVMLNKADRLSAADLAEAVGFTERICAGVVGAPVQVVSCSALSGETDPGFRAFAGELRGYLRSSGERDTDRSVRAHATRALTAIVDEARLEAAAVTAATAGRSTTLGELRDHLAALSSRRPAVHDRCAGALRRLRSELDQSAAAAAPLISRRCRKALEQAWEQDLAQVSVDRVHQAARDLVTATLTREVNGWRAAAAAALERGLQAAAAQAEVEVAAQVQLASDAARAALGVDLRDAAEPVSLVPNRDFWYDFTAPQGWAPPLSSAFTRLRGSASRRRRIRAAVTSEVGPLTDRQVGRARADLQQQLQEGGRRLHVAVARRYAETIDRFAAALARADTTQPGGSPAEGEEPVDRVRALEDLLDALGPG